MDIRQDIQEEVYKKEQLFPQLLEFPPDVQIGLMNQNYNYSELTPILNPQFNNIMKYRFYRDFCDNPVSIIELQDYISTGPQKISIFFRYENILPQYRNIFSGFKDGEILTGLYGFIYTRYKNSAIVDTSSVIGEPKEIGFVKLTYHPFQYNNEGQYTIKTEKFTDIFNILNILTNVEVDLFTLHQILETRARCNSIRPTYIKDFIRSFFDNMISDKNEYEINLYLRQNIDMLDLYNKVSLNDDLPHIEMIDLYQKSNEVNQEIQEENKHLIQVIQDYILSI